jgi:putative ABC transport system substrate-binding protein
MKNMMCLILIIAFMGAGTFAEAQQAGKVRRVGYLAAAPGPSPFFDALKQGLRDLGYVEGQNLLIDHRASEDRGQLTAMAADLVHLKMEVIVSQGAATRMLNSANTTVPVVFGFSGDPTEAGFVESLARPGTNLTGMSFMALDLAGKRLELLKEAAPRVLRVAIISTRTHPGEKNEFKETQATAQLLKTGLQYFPVTTANDFDKAFNSIPKEQVDALLTFPDAVTLTHRAQLAEFASKRKLPSMFGWKEYVDAGGLMSYGPNLSDSFRRLAIFVDKILKGAKPADLPVEQPTKFELVINLKTAKQIGLTIPPNVLARADRVIK